VTVRTPAQAASAGERVASPASPHLGQRLTKEGLPVPFDPKIHCGVKSRRTGLPCKQYRGHRTDHSGFGHCWLHGGRAPTGKRQAARQAAENALTKLNIPESEDPIAALLEALRVASWREAGLRGLLRTQASLTVEDHLGDERESVVSAMHDRALKRRAEIAKMAVDAGIDVRMTELAEFQVELAFRALQAALDAAGLDPETRKQAESAAANILDPAPPVGAELN